MTGCDEDVECGWYVVSACGGSVNVEAGDGVDGERGNAAFLTLTPDEAVKMAHHLTKMAKAARGAT